jgi:hypothetical protein
MMLNIAAPATGCWMSRAQALKPYIVLLSQLHNSVSINSIAMPENIIEALQRKAAAKMLSVLR